MSDLGYEILLPEVQKKKEKPWYLKGDKRPPKKITTITNDEDDIRFSIWSGELPMWEFTRELRRRDKIRYNISLDTWIRSSQYYRDLSIVYQLKLERAHIALEEARHDLECYKREYRSISILLESFHSKWKDAMARIGFLIKENQFLDKWYKRQQKTILDLSKALKEGAIEWKI